MYESCTCSIYLSTSRVAKSFSTASTRSSRRVADACALAQSIVDTVREPVIVLDKGLRVIAANRSFYSAFEVSPEETQGKLLYALGDGQWDIPETSLAGR
jgi:PAS domain-containing protein